MNQVENEQATAEEVVSFARQRGFELGQLLNGSIFQSDQRWIFLWRKLDHIPASGRANEPQGTLHYNMQGTISTLPSVLKDSASAFRGGWSEAGTLENIDHAFELLKAWLVEKKEVDDLPGRCTRRYGIS